MAIAEQVVRIVGAVVAVAVWTLAGRRSLRELGRPTGPGTGLAPRLGVAATYAIGAIVYGTVCVLLWRPLPEIQSTATRAFALVLGVVLGAAACALYLWALSSLGAMYNLSSSLGSELYADQRLVTSGPFAHVRHPMYAAQALAVVGALLVYRTWTTVFMAVMLIAPVVKARHEDRLLVAELGDVARGYQRRVPGLVPRVLRPRRAAGDPAVADRAAGDPAGADRAAGDPAGADSDRAAGERATGGRATASPGR
jgi:protein-S-isoprenylcysteine O-methyltransferase Ste14